MKLTKHQRGGIIGRLKYLQRASRANYEDIAMYRPSLSNESLSHEIRQSAFHQITFLQGNHRKNSERARALLFKLIEDGSNG